MINHARIAEKAAAPLESGGRCAACDKVLDDDETEIKGIHTGYPLGLCRPCGNIANGLSGSSPDAYNEENVHES